MNEQQRALSHIYMYIRAHDVAQFIEVAGDREVAVVAIASLHILVYSVNVDRNTVQKLRLNVSTHFRSMYKRTSHATVELTLNSIL